MNSEIQNEKFWSISYKEAERLLETDIENGLSEEEANGRLSRFGRNAIHSSHKAPRLKIFLNQLKSPLILVLIAAGFVTLAISHYRDSIFIFVAVIVNSALGFYQENKAENALSALKTYLKQRTRVIRGGKEREIDAEEVVIGDIIHLSQGDRVPADARLIFVNDIQVDEAVLTGESLPVNKDTEESAEQTNLSDQNSMIFAGTLVMQGVCSAIVCRTESKTELGKIATLIDTSRNEKTPLQTAIIKLSVYSSVGIGVMTLIVFVIGIFSGYSGLDMFLTAVAIAVSAIPEGLPISMTVILAVGVERMAKRKGVVRKLVAAEALGSATVVLTDKTGTLTKAEMVISKIIPSSIDERELMKMALINANALIENPDDNPKSWRISGKIMEIALIRSAVMQGYSLDEIIDKKNVQQTLPFNAANKYSASLISKSGKYMVVFLGAPDILIQSSSLGQKEKKSLLKQVDSLAYSGERILGVASKEVKQIKNYSLKNNLSLASLSFNGLITFRDPIRSGVKNAVSRVGYAGVKTVIITGDHRGTAVSVAREIGLKVGEESVLDASELAGLSDKDLQARLPELSVISRVTPYDKLRIAKLFQKSGEIVAMTGDGVNDAPCIKQANIGIAMGSGTEVAQSVADLVLLDNNFETIVAAIEEGRQILANIRKVLVYLLSNVMDGLILIGGALLTGLPLPLNALQILWVNFFTDSFPAMAFAFEKEADSLSNKPQKGAIKLFDPLVKSLIIVIGVLTSILLFGAYYLFTHLGYDESTVRTFIFAAFGTHTLLISFSMKSLNKSILSYSPFSNHYLTGGIGIGIILMASAIYLPTLQELFDTVALPFSWLMGVVFIGLFNIFLVEIVKKYFSNKYQ